jgi:Mrp family chromosome partitioning ATPase
MEMDPEEANKYLGELQECEHNCSTCSAECSSRVQKPAKQVIAVMSGKGGTGKSVFTALLAEALKKEGLKVGILDADVAQSAIPRLFGAEGTIDPGADKLKPVMTSDGIALISNGLVTRENSDEPVLWNSADTAKMAVYYLVGSDWPELDVLLIDMPSGMGDTPIEYITTMPMDCSIVVTTPGKFAADYVGKITTFSLMFMLPVLGIVENFAPDDDEKRVEALYPDIPLLATLPNSPELAEKADNGDMATADTEPLKFLARMIKETL